MKVRLLAITALAAAMLAACPSPSFRRVSVEIPAVSPAGLGSDDEIVVTDFNELEARPDLGLGRRVAEYLEAELRREFKGTVSRRTIRADPAAVDDGAFWRSAGAGLKSAVFLAGTVSLREEAQKALREADVLKDGPFKLENRGLMERKRFTLSLEYALIDARSGTVILKKSILETRTYGDIQQVAEFALFDLLPAVKARLFPVLFGRKSVQERYLLLRSGGRVSRPGPADVFP